MIRPIVEMVNGSERNRSLRTREGGISGGGHQRRRQIFCHLYPPPPLPTSPAYPLCSRAMRLWLPRAPLRADEPTSAALALTPSDAPPPPQ